VKGLLGTVKLLGSKEAIITSECAREKKGETAAGTDKVAL